MKLNLKKATSEAPGLVVGGVAANLLGKYIPDAVPEKAKPFVPLLLGIILMGQKGITEKIGMGMVAAGGANVLKSFGIGDDLSGYVIEDDINGVIEDDINGVIEDDINGVIEGPDDYNY